MSLRLPIGSAVVIPLLLAGWDAKNSRLLADKLAESGLTAALPGAATLCSCQVN